MFFFFDFVHSFFFWVDFLIIFHFQFFILFIFEEQTQTPNWFLVWEERGLLPPLPSRTHTHTHAHTPHHNHHCLRVNFSGQPFQMEPQQMALFEGGMRREGGSAWHERRQRAEARLRVRLVRDGARQPWKPTFWTFATVTGQNSRQIRP